MGEEGLYEALATSNVGALSTAKFKSIVTTDPHSYNTIRNEYPDFGGKYAIEHYTTVIQRLLESGAAIKANNLGTLAYKVSSLLSDPAWMARLKANVARIARPQAAYDVARQALAMVSARQEGS